MSEIGVALVGYKFMGRAHSNAYRQVARFLDVDPVPRMRVLCGRDEGAVRDAAGALGWEGYETDYGRVLERDDIGLVDISTPGYTHHELATAALEAGKHVLCEKPLANTLSEAREMLEAARQAGMVCHNYRRATAVQLAKYMENWWLAGHITGYEHTFVHTIKDLLDGIATGKSPALTFEDGYRCQAVLEAVEKSLESREWMRVEVLEPKEV